MQNWRQHFGADDLAGGDAHGAGRIAGAGRGAQHCAGGGGHRFGVRGDVARRIGRQQAARRADEQRRAQIGFEFGDLAAERRLGEAERPRRARQAALVENGQKCPVMAPIGFSHTKTYS